jgi:hypothetical protein
MVAETMQRPQRPQQMPEMDMGIGSMMENTQVLTDPIPAYGGGQVKRMNVGGLSKEDFEKLLIGLAKQESGNNDEAVGTANERERGRYQFKPSTALDPGYGSENILQIRDRLEPKLSYAPNPSREGLRSYVPVSRKKEDDLFEARRLLTKPNISKELASQYLQALTKEVGGGDIKQGLLAYNTGPGAFIEGKIQDPDYADKVFKQADLDNSVFSEVNNESIVADTTDQLISKNNIEIPYYETYGDALKAGVVTQTDQDNVTSFLSSPGEILGKLNRPYNAELDQSVENIMKNLSEEDRRKIAERAKETIYFGRNKRKVGIDQAINEYKESLKEDLSKKIIKPLEVNEYETDLRNLAVDESVVADELNTVPQDPKPESNDEPQTLEQEYLDILRGFRSSDDERDNLKEQAKQNALMQFGLGLMGNTSTNFLDAIGKAGQPALQKYVSDTAGIRKGVRSEDAAYLKGLGTLLTAQSKGKGNVINKIKLLTEINKAISEKGVLGDDTEDLQSVRDQLIKLLSEQLGSGPFESQNEKLTEILRTTIKNRDNI